MQERGMGPVGGRHRVHQAAALCARQTRALLRKNLVIRWRSWDVSVLQLLQSVFVVFLIWAVDKALNYSSSQFTGARAQHTSSAQAVNDIPDCTTNIYLKADEPCLSIIYTPSGHPVVDQIIAGVVRNNEPSLAPHLVQGMESQNQVDAYLLSHPQTVLSAVHFRQQSNQSWTYVLQTNSTLSYFKGQFQDPNLYIQIPLQVAIEREFARWSLNKPDLEWHVSTRLFPHPSLQSSSVVGRVAPVFLLASLLMNAVLLMQAVVGERESGLRGAMTSMGCTDTAYWTSVIVLEVVFIALHAALLTMLAIGFRFDLATRNAPELLFLLLFTAALSLGSLVLLLSNLVRRTSMTVPTCLVVFIIAWVFMIILSFGFPYNGTSAKGLVALFSLFPWSILSKGLLDLAEATTGTNAGISWAQRSSYCWANPPPVDMQAQLTYWKSDCSVPLADGFLILLAQAGSYLVLALYLDQVIPRQPGGSCKHWAFPLLPSTWLNLLCSSKLAQGQYAAHALEAAGMEATKARRDVTTVVQLDNSSAAREAASRAALASADSLINQGRQDVLMEEQRVQQVCRRWLSPDVPEPPASDSTLDIPGTAVTAPEPLVGVHLFGLKKVYSTGWRKATTAATAAPQSATSNRHKLWSWAATLVSCCYRTCAQPRAMMRGLAQWWRQARAARQLVAVHPTWLSLLPGQCYCLLGPNGAGKTTTINCLLGAVTPSDGDALVWGNSVRHPAGLDAVRHLTGVCPQFDVLWPQLTAMEHLLLFHEIKGISSVSEEDTRNLALQALEQVSLLKVADVRAGTFSGGMRRRLSLAIALLGDPLLLVLDEPTTGLDPISRRQVWSLLSDVKAGRCLLLTTHYMEEADVLGDRIGIFVGGQLQCLGSSLRLKSIMGEGVRVVVGLIRKSLESGDLSDRYASVHRIIQHNLQLEQGEQGAAADDSEAAVWAGSREEAGGSAALRPGATTSTEAVEEAASQGIHYVDILVPQHQHGRLPQIFGDLQVAAERLGIVDVQVGQASLEDVFLRVVAHAQCQEQQPVDGSWRGSD